MARCLCVFALTMLPLSSARADGALKPLTLKVGDTQREALVHIPTSAGKTPAPVILVFHGHGESMKIAAEGFGCHKHWPEAICVYLQGLRTATKSDPKGERPGWQNEQGIHGDRDLKFFDEVLAHLKKHHKVDEKRIYVSGFSNGGNFTYLLWTARGNMLAAVAPVAGVAQSLKALKPKPCLHLVGKKDGRHDKLDRVIEALGKLNNCTPEGKSWTREARITSLMYMSSSGNPLVSAVHPGGHEVPAEAGELIVRFFKMTVLK